jgi:hypothetical protein
MWCTPTNSKLAPTQACQLCRVGLHPRIFHYQQPCDMLPKTSSGNIDYSQLARRCMTCRGHKSAVVLLTSFCPRHSRRGTKKPVRIAPGQSSQNNWSMQTVQLGAGCCTYLWCRELLSCSFAGLCQWQSPALCLHMLSFRRKLLA